MTNLCLSAVLPMALIATAVTAAPPEMSSWTTGIRVPIPRPMPRPTRVVTLIGLPERMVRLDARPGWTVERQPKAARGAIGPGPGAAVYVKRTRGTGRRSDCVNPFNDEIDLAEIRRHGFRVVAFERKSFGVRPGFVEDFGDSGPRRGGPLGQDDAGKPVIRGDDLGKLAKLFVLDRPIIIKLPGPIYMCDAGYRLHLTVKGPAGIDPISGSRIRPTVVN